MALRGDRWFLGECFDQFRKGTSLSQLAERALELGLMGTENTQGHVRQPCGALQKFFEKYPNHKRTIRRSPPRAYAPTGQVLIDWKRFFASKRGKGAKGLGGSRFGYSWDYLWTYLPGSYAGKPGRGGGKGKNEFEIVARLLAAVM